MTLFRYLLFCCLVLRGITAIAQTGGVYPERPSWGDTLRISYAAGAHPVFVKLTISKQDGGYVSHTLALAGKDTLRQAFVVPATAASIAVRFYTLNKDDEKATRRLYVHEHGVPVAGAYFEDFFSDQAHVFFEKEIKGHPKNYLAYAKYFNVVSMYKGVEESRKMITALMTGLEKDHQATSTPNAALLAALCVGYAKSGRLPEGKELLLRLFKTFPQTAETALAFSLYNYEYYKATSKQIEEDVRQQLAAIYKQWPDAALTGDGNVTYYVSKLPELTVADFEKALLPRYSEGSIAYYALNYLPDIYIERRTKVDSAKAMLTRFIRLYQFGEINHQYRLSPGHYSMYMPYLLQKLADANLLLKEYEAAITNTSAGIALLAGGNYEGNFLPKLLALRANAYQQAGNLDMALEDYKQLYKTGREDALDSIRKIFPYCTAKERSFEELAATLQQKAVADQTSAAPDFTGKDLQGHTIQLSALKGKVVVVNFWGTGCGPCIGEMPALNKLVQKYQHSSHVVFLALTNDATDQLKQFFKKRTFLYTVVNNTAGATGAYAIESLPVHIVIGKQGEVVNRSTGAREDIFDYLDKVIKRSL